VVGPDELAAGEVTLRDMMTKVEERVNVADIAAHIGALFA
jgi:histidyl-tRNA synthetase